MVFSSDDPHKFNHICPLSILTLVTPDMFGSITKIKTRTIHSFEKYWINLGLAVIPHRNEAGVGVPLTASEMIIE